jgi:hypothetical protein
LNFIKTISTFAPKNESQDMTVVNMFYEDFSVTEIEETPVMDVVTLLSNIGGVAGLFLGVSLLSFFEMFAFLLKAIQIAASKQAKISH